MQHKWNENNLSKLPRDEKLIVVPAGGWEEHTLYLVAVAWSKSNPIHYAYLETGFINDAGAFGGYCSVWCNSYDNAINASEAHYLFPVKKMNTIKDREIPAPYISDII